MRGIAKRFPGVQALAGVDLDLAPGEVHGLAGENGSGKSTLVKVLAGRYAPDAGEVRLDGERVAFGSAAAGLRSGVALIAQEVLVHPDLSVAENLLFGRMPRRRAGGLAWGEAHVRAQAILDRLGLDADPRARLGGLALHAQHMVAIGKMVERRPRVLVLDEPTSSLTEQEVETLFGLLRELREAGTAIVYVTHRLREYFELCDRMTVLRDGARVTTEATADLDEHTLVRLMVGRELTSIFTRPDRPAAPAADAGAPPVLRVRGLTTDKLRGVDLDVRAGEVVGVAGQAGAGRSSLARTLFGVHAYGGTVEVEGREVRLRSPRDAMRAGIGFVPEDRKAAGLVLTMSVAENVTMPQWDRLSRLGVQRRAGCDEVAREAIETLRIRCPGAGTLAGSLSGGNQQKIVIAKWLARRPKVLVLDEPTRGIDVGAKAEIYALVESLAAQGLGVVVLSSELLELLRLSDRVVVMAGGRVVGEQAAAEATEESVTALAFQGLSAVEEDAA
jgi:ABC-type sugar transport system ATPase subunit